MRFLAGLMLFLGLTITACSSYRFLDTYTGDLPGVVRETREVAKHLDAIAEDLEEFGTASVSAAAVIRRPQDHFGFRLKMTPKDIFEWNRIEASSAALDHRAVEVRIAAAVQLLQEANLMTDAVEAAATRGRAEGLLASGLLSAVNAEGAGGEEDDGDGEGDGDEDGDGDGDGDDGDDGDGDDEPGSKDDEGGLQLPTNAAKTDVAGGELTKREADALNMPLRQLIQLTFDDHTTLKLFEWLSEPDSSTLGDNKVLFAAILNVSLRPGWRTERGYIGEIDVNVGYGASYEASKEDYGILRSGSSGEMSATKLQVDPSRHPLAFAVFPMVDSQVMDLRSSVKRQLSLALMMQALAPKSEVSAQAESASRIESQIASITPRNTVTSYSMSGRHFGWRFMPRLDALGDPSASRAKAALRLEPQSFPVLVFLLADEDDLRKERSKAGSRDEEVAKGLHLDVEWASARQRLRVHAGTIDEQVDGSVEERSLLQFDHFVFYYTMRWLRAPSSALRSWWAPNRWLYRSSHPRLTEVDQVEWGLRIADARSRIQSIRCEMKVCEGMGCGDACGRQKSTGSGSTPQNSKTIHTTPLLSTLEKRLKMLEAASIGADVYAEIPELRGRPEVDSKAVKYHGWQNRKNVFAVRGKNFIGQVFEATIEGRECRVKVPSDEVVIVECDPWKSESTQSTEMSLYLVTSVGPIEAGTVTFDRVADEETKIAPFAELKKSSPVIGGKTLRFSYDPSKLPVGRGKFKLFLRRAGGSKDDWRSIDELDVALDKASKEMRITFKPPSEPSWMKVAERLEVDVRLARNDTLDPASVLIEGSARDFVNTPKAELLSPKLTTSTLDYGDNNTTDGEIVLEFAGGLDGLRRVYRDALQGIENQDIRLVVMAGKDEEVCKLKLIDRQGKLVVETDVLNEKAVRDALLPSTSNEKKYDALRLSFKGFGKDHVAIRGELTVKRKVTSI